MFCKTKVLKKNSHEAGFSKVLSIDLFLYIDLFLCIYIHTYTHKCHYLLEKAKTKMCLPLSEEVGEVCDGIALGGQAPLKGVEAGFTAIESNG